MHIFQTKPQLIRHYHLSVILFGVFHSRQQFVLITITYGSRVGKTGAHTQHLHLFRRIHRHILTDFGPRSDNAHIPFYHIDKLGKLVQFVFTNKMPRAGNPRVISSYGYKPLLIRPYSHRPKLVKIKITISPPYPYLSIKYRTRRIQFYPYCNRCKYRRQNDQYHRTGDYIKNTLTYGHLSTLQN